MRTRLVSIGALALGIAFGPAGLSAQTVHRDMLILSPEPGEQIGNLSILVAVSFLGEQAVKDAEFSRIEIDGRDVTDERQLRGSVVTWKPNQQLAAGPHRMVVTTRDSSGVVLAERSWAFTAKPEQLAANVKSSGQLPIAGEPVGGWWMPHGTFILAGTSSSISGAGADLRQQDNLQPNMWLNAGGSIGHGWRYTTQIHLSGDESKFAQPVNRYRFDLRAPFFKVSLGDVNPFMQDLILAGRRVRGVSGELRAGALRLSMVSGQSRRAIPGLLGAGDTTILRSGTFGQNLFAVRPAFGAGDKFQLGFTFMHARDDVQSIPDLRVEGNTSTFARSANSAPKDNVVGGLDLTLRLFAGHVLFQYENAISLLANDISQGPLTEAGLDSIMNASGNDHLGIDPSQFKDFFVLNASMIPLDPRGLTNVAHQLRTSVRAGTHTVAFEWHSIGAAYRTLGYPALQTDLRGFRLNDAFTLVSDALVGMAGFEQDEDNLDDSKTATTTSSGGYASLSWQKSRNSVYLTGYVRQGTRSNDVTSGQAGAMDETNTTFSGAISVPVAKWRDRLLRVSFNTSFIQRTDPESPAPDTRDTYLLGGLTAQSEDQLSMYSLLFGVNKSELVDVANGTTDFKRGVLSVRHQLKPKLALLLDGTWTKATGNQAIAALDYHRLDMLGGAEYEVMPAMLLTLNAGVISYSDQRDSNFNTNETVVRLNVRRAF